MREKRRPGLHLPQSPSRWPAVTSHSFTGVLSVVLPSDSNAWVSFLSCGSGDSTTNRYSAFTSSEALTGGPELNPVLFGSYRLPPHLMGGSNGGTGRDLIQQGPSLPTGSPPPTTTSPAHNQGGFVGWCPKLHEGGYRFRILARPRGVENTLQGETWPFLYPTQGMYPPDATTVKPGLHPSRYRGPRYHQIRILSIRTRHPYF